LSFFLKFCWQDHENCKLSEGVTLLVKQCYIGMSEHIGNILFCACHVFHDQRESLQPNWHCL